MKPPMSRFSKYGSNGTWRSTLMLQTPISLSSSVLAAVRSKVLTLTLYFGWATVPVTVRALDPLPRHAERRLVEIVGDLDCLQVSDEGRPPIPRRIRAALGDVVALECRHRDAHDVGQADLLRELSVRGLDLVEDVFREVDEVELVDGEDDLADAEQRDEVAVAARL